MVPVVVHRRRAGADLRRVHPARARAHALGSGHGPKSVDERIRIARELHGKLLQGVQGLLLNFHVAAQKIPPDDASRGMLDRSLATADRIILEGRNRVSSLRSEQ